MRNNHVPIYRTVIFVLIVVLGVTLVHSPRSTQAAPQAAGAQMLAITVIDVPLSTRADVTNDWVKLTDLGTFSVHSADSMLELTFNGRLYAYGFSKPITMAHFELRVNDSASLIGRARTAVTNIDDSPVLMPASFTGMFNGLKVGDHTASMWVRSTAGTTISSVTVNPNGLPVDVLIVKEYLPFGFSYLPMIAK